MSDPNEKEEKPQLPGISQWLLKRVLFSYSEIPVLGDLEEGFRKKCLTEGRRKARWWYRVQALKSLPVLFKNMMYGSSYMIKNYLKIAFRNLLKHKGFALINILGLGIGIACCVLIVLYVGFERSFDSYHPDADKIYRIGTHINRPGEVRTTTFTCVPFAPYVKQNFPQADQAVRISRRGNVLVKRGERVFFESDIVYADKEIFRIFAIPFIKGNPEQAMSGPGTIVLSQSTAKKYFGNEDPIGKSITVNSNDYLISGIVKDSPKNTHLQYNMLSSLENLNLLERWKDRWGTLVVQTYVKLAPHANNDDFIQLLISKARTHNAAGVENTYFFQPIKDIHLRSYQFDRSAPPTRPMHLYIFSAIAVLILLIASMNYINLSTARYANRTKEIGVRKAVGARRNQLIQQFMGESLLTTLISLIAAVAFVLVSLPVFNKLVEMQFTVKDLFRTDLLVSIVCMILFTGLIAGSYPAFVLSAFKPVNTLKGRLRSGTKSGKARKSLVILQFAVSIVLIIGTMVVYLQLNYMKNKNLGFSKDQKLILPIKTRSNLSQNYASVKNEFLQYSRITGATASSGIPGRIGTQASYRLIYETEAEGRQIKAFFVDSDFIHEYKIKLAAGTPVFKMSTSEQRSITMINEAAAKAFGFPSPRDAIGKELVGWNTGKIEGVIEDFNFVGLQEEIAPLVMVVIPYMYQYVSLTISTQEISQTLSFISGKWKELFPGIPMEYYFLDDDFDRFYRAEEKTGKLVGIFALFGVFIACLGLFGLSCFMAEQRTKEIAIRKVHGAKVLNITSLQVEDFIKWIFIAIIFAWPAAYIVTTKWLQNFAYHIDLNIWIFILSGLAAVGIALATVSYQSIKAALANPIDSLRYE